MAGQVLVFFVIALLLYFFARGKVRYEFVSTLGVLFLTFAGIITPEEAFSGFSHPAVITVASILVISASLVKSGVAEDLILWLNRKIQNPNGKIAGLMLVTAFLSAFMNNIGALALMLPVSIRAAKDSKQTPSKFLMPISFASLLGGMVTVIGTPPNLIVSDYRTQATGNPFAFFDFAPIGVTLVVLGIAFVVGIGIRLIPVRESQQEEDFFNIGEYFAEVVVTETSKMAGKRVRALSDVFHLEVQVLGINRLGTGVIIPKGNENLLAGDLLVVKTTNLELTDLINRTGMTLRGAKLRHLEEITSIRSDDFSLVEVVLREDSFLVGRTAVESQLRNRYNVNLVAVSRKGHLSITRLKSLRFQAGDILLLQAPATLLRDTCQKMSCLPLSQRQVSVNVEGNKTNKYLPLALFAAGILLTTLGVLPVQIAFSSVAILMAMLKVISAREFYQAVEWPTIILLGTLLPLGGALQKSGVSGTIAGVLTGLSGYLPPVGMLVVLMLMTVAVTNLISGTGTAVLMGPIAVGMATSIGAAPDAFLMGVCIASSSAFLTPIAHQSNMLVMGPGGYKFTDYWRLGLPLSVITITLAAVLIPVIWQI